MSSSTAAATSLESMAGAVTASFGEYTESSAYEEIQATTSGFSRARLESPNLVVIEGKGFVFNSKPPLDTAGVLGDRLSVSDFTAAVDSVNRAVARAVSGQPRAVVGSAIPRRRALCKKAAEDAVAKLNRCLEKRFSAGETRPCRWEIVCGEAHEHVTDVSGHGCGNTSYGVSSKKVSWVGCRLCVVFEPTPLSVPVAGIVADARSEAGLGDALLGGRSLAEELAILSRLHAAGELTDDEWKIAKSQTLAGKGISTAA